MGRTFDASIFVGSNPMLTATQMHARARRLKRQHGLDLVVIDYLQLMTEGGENRNTELSTITRKLLMAKDLNVPVICLSQLSRKDRMGPTGTVYLAFQGEFSRFVNFSGSYHSESSQRGQKRGFQPRKSYVTNDGD